jgi:TonB-linked SusC/RagA family outer membrane protein
MQNIADSANYLDKMTNLLHNIEKNRKTSIKRKLKSMKKHFYTPHFFTGTQPLKLLLRSCVLLLLLLLTNVAFAQERLVTGKVTTVDDNSALPGVSILIKGTTIGTTTDADGNYSLSVPNGDAVLIFSFIGFTVEEFIVGALTVLDVAMSADITQLSEVVVTAFGVEQERKSLGYSVQEVDSKLITETNQVNALNSLRGRLSGVNITSSSGAPGAGTTIVIRGINSLNPGANNQPLFVIDGIPVSNETNITGGREGSNFTNTNRFADINPEDIESISVLKGPAASALYGLRAANGAVIVTTKSGKSGKTVFNFKTTYSFDDVYRTPPLQTKYGRGTDGLFSATDYRADGPPIPTGEPVYDQWDAVFRTGNQFQNNFSVSGGNDKATFFASMGRLDQRGVVPNSEFERNTIKFAGSLKATSNLTLEGSANFINSKGTNPRSGVGTSGVVSYASRYAPDVDMSNYINEDGTPIRYSTLLENPLFFAENAYQEEKLNRIIGNIGLNYDLTDWLNINYRVGIDNYSDQRFIITRPTLLIAATSRGTISEQFLTYQEINSNLLISGKRQFSENLNLSVSLGNQVTGINTSSVTGSGENFIVPTFNSVNNLSLYTVRSFPTERNIIGVFGDVKLNYKETVFLNVTGRNDWSSTLPVQNRSFFYPSASLAYVFSETLNLNSSVLNYGKLRAAYAEVGKDADPYQIGNYYSTLAQFRGIASVRRTNSIGSENLRPERTKGLEFGIELSLLSNRITLDANYAIQNSIDQIVPVPTSSASGFTTYVTNAGEVENKVVELMLSADIVKNTDFRITTTVNWTRLRGKVLSMPEGVNVIVFQPETPWVKQKIQTGGRPGDWYGWELSRVDDPESGSNGRLVIGANGYPDVNDRWKGRALAEDDYIGNAFPDWEGGVNNSLQYKNFEFSFLFTFRKGGYAFDINRRMRYSSGGTASPTGSETELRNRLVVFDGVVNTGTLEAPVWVENQQAVVLDVTNFYEQAFRYRLAREFNGFQDASFLRLQNVSISYSLPKSLLSKTPFTKVTGSVTGNNLWMTSPFIGFDPEQSAYGVGSNVFGYVGTNIPATRSFFVGLNLTF